MIVWGGFDQASNALNTGGLYTPGVEDQTPGVNAGGPYVVEEGSTVLVTASGYDPNGDPLTYTWDLDTDGTFETPGQSVTFSATAADGPSIYSITVQVSDTVGLSATDQTTVAAVTYGDSAIVRLSHGTTPIATNWANV